LTNRLEVLFGLLDRRGVVLVGRELVLDVDAVQRGLLVGLAGQLAGAPVRVFPR